MASIPSFSSNDGLDDDRRNTLPLQVARHLATSIKRREFTAEIKKLNPEDLVYVDESGIDHFHFRKYARSPRNTRVYGVFPVNI